MKRIIIILSTIILILFTVSSLMADARGKFKGSILDSGKKPLENAKITIQSLRIKSEQYEIQTKKNGSFSYVGLKPYKYKIIIEKKGYQTYIEPSFKIRAGKWVTLDVQLFTIEEAKQKSIESMSPEQRAVLYYNDAMDAFNMEDYDKTIEKLKESVKNNPKLAKAYLKLGIVYYSKKKDFEAAKKAFENALTSDEELTLAYEFLGQINIDAGQMDKALEYWKKYFELGGDSGIVAENIGVIYIKKKDNKNARKYFEKGIDVDPEYAPLYKKLGDVCMRSGDYRAAVKYYKQYLELEPEAPDKDLVNRLIPPLEKAAKNQKK